MVSTSKEEFTECRNRNNPVKDETQMFSKTGVADTYTCTESKARKNKREEIEELARIEKEFAL